MAADRKRERIKDPGSEKMMKNTRVVPRAFLLTPNRHILGKSSKAKQVRVKRPVT